MLAETCNRFDMASVPWQQVMKLIAGFLSLELAII